MYGATFGGLTAYAVFNFLAFSPLGSIAIGIVLNDVIPGGRLNQNTNIRALSGGHRSAIIVNEIT